MGGWMGGCSSSDVWDWGLPVCLMMCFFGGVLGQHQLCWPTTLLSSSWVSAFGTLPSHCFPAQAGPTTCLPSPSHPACLPCAASHACLRWSARTGGRQLYRVGARPAAQPPQVRCNADSLWTRGGGVGQPAQLKEQAACFRAATRCAQPHRRAYHPAHHAPPSADPPTLQASSLQPCTRHRPPWSASTRSKRKPSLRRTSRGRRRRLRSRETLEAREGTWRRMSST